MSLQNIAAKIAAKVVTPEKITPLAEKMLLDIIGEGENAKVYRIQGTVEGGPNGDRFTGNVAVTVFDETTGKRLSVETLEGFLNKILSGVKIPGLNIADKMKPALEAAKVIFNNPYFYYLIGAQENPQTQKRAVAIMRAEITFDENDDGQQVEVHTPGETQYFADVFPAWYELAKNSGQLPDLEKIAAGTPDQEQD